MNKVIFFVAAFVGVMRINSQITVTPVKQNGPNTSENDSVIKIYGVLPLNSNGRIYDGMYESYYLDGPLHETWITKNGHVQGDYYEYYEKGGLKTKIQYGIDGCSIWPGEIGDCSAIKIFVDESGDTSSIIHYTSGIDTLTNVLGQKYWMVADYYPNHKVKWTTWDMYQEDTSLTPNSFFHPKVRETLLKYVTPGYFGINGYSVHCFYDIKGNLTKFFECNQSVRYNGKYLLFYEDGTPKLIAEYKNDKYNGLYTEFYENGQKKMEAFLKDGNYVGEYKKYSPKGKLIKSVIY